MLTIGFQTFIAWALLLIVHTWKSSPLRSNLLRLQCTCTVPTTSGRPHGSPLVWACQWPSSQPLSSPQLSHNASLWGWGKKQKSQGARLRNSLDAHIGQIVCDKDGVVDWCIVLLEMPTDPIWRVLASSDGISSWTPLKPQHSNPNSKPLANQLWCIDYLTPPTALIIPHTLPAFLESLMAFKKLMLDSCQMVEK